MDSEAIRVAPATAAFDDGIHRGRIRTIAGFIVIDAGMAVGFQSIGQNKITFATGCGRK